MELPQFFHDRDESDFQELVYETPEGLHPLDVDVYQAMSALTSFIEVCFDSYYAQDGDVNKAAEAFFFHPLVQSLRSKLSELPDAFLEVLGRRLPDEFLDFAEVWELLYVDHVAGSVDIDDCLSAVRQKFLELGMKTHVPVPHEDYSGYYFRARVVINYVGYILTEHPEQAGWVVEFLSSLPDDDPLSFLLSHYFSGCLPGYEYPLKQRHMVMNRTAKSAIRELILYEAILELLSRVMDAGDQRVIEGVFVSNEYGDDPFADVRDMLRRPAAARNPFRVFIQVLELMVQQEDGRLLVHQQRLKHLFRSAGKVLFPEAEDTDSWGCLEWNDGDDEDGSLGVYAVV